MRKKVISALLITTMTITSIIPAYALSKGETVKQPTPVEVTTEAMQFDVTLPTKLPVTVKSDGEVVVATTTKIENNGFGPIVVKNLDVTPTTGWEIVEFNHDFSTEYMNSKKFGMTIYNIPVATDGSYPILEVSNGSYPKIYGNNYVNILYKVNTGTFIEDTTLDMATVTVTVGWDEAEIKDFEIKPPKVDVSELNPEDYGVDYIVEVGTQFYVTGVATYALDGEDPFYGVIWESSDTSVATVGAQDGLVTVLKAGYFDITGTLPSGESASVKYGVPKEGTSEIPEPVPVVVPYLTFEEESGQNFTFKMSAKNWNGTLEYSTDTHTWIEYTSKNTTVNSVNGKLYLRGNNNTHFSISTETYDTIILPSSLKIKCIGNIETLLDYQKVVNGEHPTMEMYCFLNMFKDCESLTQAPELPATTVVDAVYQGIFEGCTSLTEAPELPATSLIGSCYKSMFSGCTSLKQAPALPATELSYGCYESMFKDCTSLTQAPDLPATTLAWYCYYNMFSGCTSLTKAPELPATSLPNYCYQCMFEGCTSLTKAPDLPATKLNQNCYYGMFWNCTSLIQAPALPATKLYISCYTSMFNGCSSLTQAPALPATELVNNCYQRMFSGCTSLTQAPELPATTTYGIEYCYDSMFMGCTSLTQAPALPAKALGKYCYQYMFSGCTSLTQAPSLPARTLYNSDYCYRGMFRNCTSLTQTPVLPATSLANGCYQGMFQGCTSLTQTSVLPATNLANYCYREMFKECNSLIQVPELPATTTASYCYYSMFQGCTKIKLSETETIEYSIPYRIPTTGTGEVTTTTALNDMFGSTGGTFTGTPTINTTYYLHTSCSISEPETPDEFLTFEEESGNEFTFKMSNKNWDGTLEYSTDARNWTEYADASTTVNSVNGKLYLRGSNNTRFATSASNYSTIILPSSLKIKCTGNIETLIDWQTVDYDECPTMSMYCFLYLFENCTSLTQAPDLPATTLKDYCYQGIFRGCTSLTQAPSLPATTLANYCYQYMFSGCTSLTQAPDLPATTLRNYCYSSIFSGCKSLTKAPKLPATTLKDYCYQYMFSGCTSLTQAPSLPATTLANYCYDNMFNGCTSLTQVPALPATTLRTYCYQRMFYRCTKLKLSTTQTDDYNIPYRIPITGAGTGNNATYNMFQNTGGTFSGTPTINTTYYLHNSCSIAE